MKNLLLIICSTILTKVILAQAPGSAMLPMTAPGAIGIHLSQHSLVWVNPQNANYNELYFSNDSSLVANLDVSVRLLNGYPSTVFSTAQLSSYGTLDYNTKYFWRVVEYNSSGNTASPLWQFKSVSPSAFSYGSSFDSGLEGWTIVGPGGLTNWYWQNTTAAGGYPGEIVFSWTPLFTGDDYIMSPEYPAAAGSYMALNFKYYEDWWSDTVVVGCAYTIDNGNSWTSLWELHATGNVGPSYVDTAFYIPGNFRLGYYYTGYSNNIDFYFVDDVQIVTPLTVALPPSFLQSQSSSTELKVNLAWNQGYSPDPITGYRIQRKNGMPSDASPYITIATTNATTYTYQDQDVELNHNYTYRICTLSALYSSSFGNEATAYVPESVPVELVSFTGTYSENQVTLEWQTATEINNSGFEIQRSINNNDWEQIGFVNGNGTTTENHFYTFIDKNLSANNYFYRLKQVDYDGTFEYSNVIEIGSGIPDNFSLSQNYPNPFNPSTKISYQIPVSSNVTLQVYDALGNIIATLLNEQKPAGKYDVDFNASSLSSGVYFYKLKAGSFIETKKMLLCK